MTVAAYGQMLAVHAANTALSGTSEASFKSNLGYSGEQWDASLRMQNLRARPYDPASGRFIGLDPFAGNMQDPQSLHKYAYVHGDPIQGIDPTGEMFSASVGVAGAIVGGLVGATVAWSNGYRPTDWQFWALTFGGAAFGFVLFGFLPSINSISLLLRITTYTAVGLAVYNYLSNEVPNSRPTAAQQAKINSAISAIASTPGYSGKATQLQNMSYRVFSQKDFEAWAYVSSGNAVMYVSSELLESDTEIIASVLVHERKHTDWLPYYRSTFEGERAAYQEQSDYMRKRGIFGTRATLRSSSPNTPVSWFSDQADSMRYYQTINPAVTP